MHDRKRCLVAVVGRLPGAHVSAAVDSEASRLAAHFGTHEGQSMDPAGEAGRRRPRHVIRPVTDFGSSTIPTYDRVLPLGEKILSFAHVRGGAVERLTRTRSVAS